MFYKNNKSIIIGRSQNPWKECKLEKLDVDKVDLCRRYSGGGAVY
jgi:lipoate-protein ligase A